MFFSTVTIPAILIMAVNRDGLDQEAIVVTTKSFQHPLQQRLFPRLFENSSLSNKPRLQRQLTHYHWEQYHPALFQQEEQAFVQSRQDDNAPTASPLKLRSHPTQSHLVQRFAASASHYWNLLSLPITRIQ